MFKILIFVTWEDIFNYDILLYGYSVKILLH